MTRNSSLALLFLAALSISIFLPAGEARAAEPFRRGDSNGDGGVNLGDAVYVLDFLFQGTSTVPCLAATDANGDNILDLTDAVYLLLYLFQAGAAPPAPGPIKCGLAPAGSLDCDSYSLCGVPPQITTGPKATPAEQVTGERVSLTVAATDADVETLTYSWTQIDPPTPQGTFISGRTAATAGWRSPALGAQTDFTFQVVVTDPAGHSTSGTTSVMVNLPAYGTNIQPIWTASCSCHNTAFPSGSLPLGAGKSFAALVNVAANTCRPLKRVVPLQPDNSQLYKRIAGGTCGTRMPEGNTGFFDSNPNQLIRIRSWILAGALNN